jgi:hypothetical protein
MKNFCLTTFSEAKRDVTKKPGVTEEGHLMSYFSVDLICVKNYTEMPLPYEVCVNTDLELRKPSDFAQINLVHAALIIRGLLSANLLIRGP